MKTTLDLPDALLKEIKLKALHEGRKLKDVMAETLRKGLAVTESGQEQPVSVLTTDEQTGLPLIQCRHAAAERLEPSPKRVAEILLDAESSSHS